MGAAIGPRRPMKIRFSPENFVRLLQQSSPVGKYDRPVLRTVKGGSRRLCGKDDRGPFGIIVGGLRRDIDLPDAAWRLVPLPSRQKPI